MKIVSFLMLFMFSVGSFACQKMDYDPWVHFVTKKEMTDSNGIMLWMHDGNRIYGAHMVYAGIVSGDRVLDCNGSLVARKSGDFIMDASGRIIFRISGDRVYDAYGKVVARVTNDRIYNADGSTYGTLR